jgi:hypothetical protein
VKGQISIEYTGGALLFFSSILFVVAGVLGTLPQFTSAIDENSIETQIWASTALLLSDTGQWESDTRVGPDWHNNIENTTQLGLVGQDGDLSRDKIRQFVSMDYSDVKVLLRTEKDFNIRFTEFSIIDTASSFEKTDPQGNIGEVITEPTGSSYDSANDTIRYGSISANGAEKNVLVTAHQGNYDTVYISEDWDFTDAIRLGPTGNQILSFDGRRYRLSVPDSGVFASDGKTVVLTRPLGNVGTRTPAAEATVVTARRFGNIGSNPVRIDVEMWS